ncbi:MAG TPA: L-lactate dehydrogenase [Thermoanaerobaculia bacterium]|nr:L-lactate dehydrogenase [Thermoanaerobaculia bacterium]
MSRVGIVGTGWVGSSVAISTLQRGIATELLLHDVRGAIAEGEAMDLGQGAPFYPPASVRATELDEMRACDAVVVTAGRGGRPGETRLDLLKDNAATARRIGETLRGFGGIIVVVTNPVDVLTSVMTAAAGLPPARVIGTGTMLDTARLRQMLGRELGVDPRSVHAQVVGEHGDSEVVLWEGARAGGLRLRDWTGWSAAKEERIAAEVRTAAYEIIRRKGATNHAIGLVTASLLAWMLRGDRRILTVTRVQEGAAGIRDVALSLPAIVGRQGATEVLEPEMSTDERARLDRSAQILREALAPIRDAAFRGPE